MTVPRLGAVRGRLPPDRPFVNLAETFARTILDADDFTPAAEAILRQATLVTAVRDLAS